MKNNFRSLAHLLMVHALRVVVHFRLLQKPFPPGSLMVIAPHPDDEVIGAGAVILGALSREESVHLVYLTDGEAACPGQLAETVKQQRMNLTRLTAEAIGIPDAHLHYLHLPDGGVPHRDTPGYQEALAQLQQLIECYKPDHVLATHEMDYWPFDHVACAQLAEGAVARSAHSTNLYAYWVWAWYHLRPWRVLQTDCQKLFAVKTRPWARRKQALVDGYLKARAEDGTLWSGELPLALRRASRFRIEVIEKRITAR